MAQKKEIEQQRCMLMNYDGCVTQTVSVNTLSIPADLLLDPVGPVWGGGAGGVVWDTSGLQSPHAPNGGPLWGLGG